MKSLAKTFLSGALVLVPMAITIWVLWSVGAWMDNTGRTAVDSLWGKGAAEKYLFRGAGALLLLAAIYLVGLLTNIWGFRPLWARFERLLGHLPGVKIIYESVRDLMKLFGGGGSKGRVVEYRPPGSDVAVLGIVTNEKPSSEQAGGNRVAVYLPMAYMLGGPTVLTAPENLRELKMSVEEALKLAATAHAGSARETETPKK